MAYVAADWTVDRQTGNIRYTGADHNGVSPSYATVIEAHRAWAALADDPTSTASNDELDITDNTPSDRSTDNIITLLGIYNIDAASAEHLYDGSIIYNGGADIYDGIVNFGNAQVQIQLQQNGAVIADDYWNRSIGGAHDGGDGAATLDDSGASFGATDGLVGYTIYNTSDGSQALITANDGTTITGILYGGAQNDWDDGDTYEIGIALNGSATAGISHRFMVKTRTAGVDIDGKRMLGIARRFGRTYSEFKINGSTRGNNVLALSDATDLNNSTSPADVSLWDQFANDNPGYDATQDINIDTVNEFYYSRWDIGGGATPASPTINDLYEWSKWITTQGTALTMYGLSGELFRGITLEIVVDNPSTATNFSAFELVEWSTGTGQLLAINDVDAPTKMWIQLLTGVAPINNDVINSDDNPTTTADVNVTVTDREPLITKPFLGASTGSSIIGGYGIGIASEDLTASDILFDLGNAQVTPPNNVTVTISGLIATEDYVKVAQRGFRFAYDAELSGPFVVGETLTLSGAATATVVLAELVDQGTTGYMIVSEAVTGSLSAGTTADNAVIDNTPGTATAAINGAVSSDINKRQFTLATTLNTDLAGGPASVVINGAIDSDTPSSGFIRVQDNNGFYRKIAYASYTGSTFTTGASGTEDDFSTVNATGGAGPTGNRNVYIGYLDLVATATSASFTGVFSANRNLFVRVRDGASTPIKTFESTVTMSSSGGSATAIRTTDE